MKDFKIMCPVAKTIKPRKRRFYLMILVDIAGVFTLLMGMIKLGMIVFG